MRLQFLPFVQKLLARQFYRPNGFWGRAAIDFMAVANRSVYVWADDFLHLAGDDHFLEIGFGHGDFILHCLKKYSPHKTAGVDLSPETVQKARVRFNKYISKQQLQLEIASSENMPFAAESFTKVLAVNVIYFWQKPLVDLLEIYRVLKPGGMVVLYLTDAASLLAMAFPGQPVFLQHSPQKIAVLLGEVGFREIEIHTKIFHFKNMDVSGNCIVACK